MSTSLIPTGVPSDFKPKSFWQRPEGGAGKGLVIALTIGAGVALFIGWGTIVPFVLTTVADTFWLIGYLACLGIIADVAFGIEPIGQQFKVLIRNVFQSVARGLACTYTTIDPIGILRNNLDDMKKEKEGLDTTVARFSGSEEQLKRKIAAKTAESKQAFAESQFALNKAASTTDPMEKQRLTYASQTSAEKAGLLLQGVKQLQDLEHDTSHLLTTFQSWSQMADAKIQRTSFKVDFLDEQRQAILAAKDTLSYGQRLLKGSPEKLQMVDMAIEYLEQDTAQTLGQIREFSRFTDKLSTDQDIESGANAELARQQFAEFSQKLLTAGNTPSAADLLQIPGIPNATPAPLTRSAAAGSGSSTDDFDPFK